LVVWGTRVHVLVVWRVIWRKGDNLEAKLYFSQIGKCCLRYYANEKI